MEYQNFKIVCIVNNPSDDSDMGLVHAFKHDRNSTLNLFIKQYLYEFDGRNYTTHLGSNNSLNYLLINVDKVEAKSQLDAADKWEILLVSDSIILNPDFFKIFDENTLLMYHTTPHISIQDTITTINNQRIKKGKKGQHEPYENQGYQRLLKLTEAWQNGSFDQEKYANAKQHIIDWFGINDELEAKLELLHNCLVPKSIPDELDDLISSYNDKFSEFKEAIKKEPPFDNEYIEPFKEKYIEALTKFRDALLGF